MQIQISSNIQQTIDALDADLQTYRQNLSLTVFRALSLIEAEALRNLQGACGLHVRTGALLGSLNKSVNDAADPITGTLASVGVPYAAIQEFGGTTGPHVIEPRVRQALMFYAGGKKVFAKRVNHPGSVIPARPYLRPALAATQQQIVEQFGLFILAAFPQAKAG